MSGNPLDFQLPSIAANNVNCPNVATSRLACFNNWSRIGFWFSALSHTYLQQWFANKADTSSYIQDG